MRIFLLRWSSALVRKRLKRVSVSVRLKTTTKEKRIEFLPVKIVAGGKNKALRRDAARWKRNREKTERMKEEGLP